MSGTIICRPPGRVEVQIMSGTIICRPPGRVEVQILPGAKICQHRKPTTQKNWRSTHRKVSAVGQAPARVATGGRQVRLSHAVKPWHAVAQEDSNPNKDGDSRSTHEGGFPSLSGWSR
ncbi:hypothetical protein [Candidatus Spongiihabitans sp.]|uniref:hypothetical protein n=1 Tax=Candidatus Spongiihabitans sp. TaxID=3101308 RepID=UPI003C7C6E3B